MAIHAFIVHAKNPDPADPKPYKGYFVAASDDDEARRLIPKGYRIDGVERCNPITGAVVPALLGVMEIAVAVYEP
jgi:hypothetical protein